MQLDILAFAAHPDDAELACAGTLMMHQLQGYNTGIIDLTQGELGTRGSAALRMQEAAASSQILQLSARENLQLRDGWFSDSEDEVRKLIIMLRKYRPRVVLANAVEDRHPDHGRGASLAARACFLSGLRKIETELDGQAQEAWRPLRVYHYIQDRLLRPDLVVDITPVWERKREAIQAFRSQFFDPNSSEPVTYISTGEFWNFLEGRAREMGHYIGAPFGEGFTSVNPLAMTDMLQNLGTLA